MAEDAGKQQPPSLDEFGSRLDAARGDRATTGPRAGTGAALGRAFRVASELLAGLIVGVVLGVALDRWLDAQPWFLLAGIALGFAAGLRNVARALKSTDSRRPPEDGSGE
jgi:ATP synthase protein I